MILTFDICLEGGICRAPSTGSVFSSAEEGFILVPFTPDTGYYRIKHGTLMWLQLIPYGFTMGTSQLCFPFLGSNPFILEVKFWPFFEDSSVILDFSRLVVVLWASTCCREEETLEYICKHQSNNLEWLFGRKAGWFPHRSSNGYSHSMLQ